MIWLERAIKMTDGYEKAEVFRLGSSSSGWGEDFVQNLVADDPSILGLGDLNVKDKERRQIGAGRLDFLLQDSPVTIRYAVEIQLGDTDPSHIVRTIEYWDRERRNSPQYDHVAVIVAEGITARFFNVISLFNQHIPLIAIKMSAIELAGKRTIIFTKILDHTPKTFEDEEAGIPETNRTYWEDKSSPATMSLVDAVVSIAKKIDPTIGPRFIKSSIPLKKGAEFWRILTLRPKKKFLKISLPSVQSSETEEKLNAADIDFEYDQKRSRYILTVVPGDLPKHSDLIETLILNSYKQGGSEAEEPIED
jgi:hypothetical protein